MSTTQVETRNLYESLSHSTNTVKTNDRTKMSVNAKHRTFSKYYDRYMILIAVFGSIFVYLQAATILVNKSSENVSMASYILFLIVSLSWMLYGILWLDWLVIVSGIVSSIGAITALVATISYRPSSNPGPFVTIF